MQAPAESAPANERTATEGETAKPAMAVVEDERPQFEIVRASDVEPVEIRYRWPSRVPVGMLTLVAGPPGDGKTMAFCGYYPAIRSTGMAWHDGGVASEPGDVLIISTEDDIAATHLDAAAENVLLRFRRLVFDGHALTI